VLEDRTHEGVVDSNHRSLRALPGRCDNRGDVRHAKRRVGGRFDEHHGQIFGFCNCASEARGITRVDGNRVNAVGFHQLVEKHVGATVDGYGVDNGTPGSAEGQQQRGNGRHPRVEDGRTARTLLERDEVVFENFGVRMGEARVDEFDVLTFDRVDLPQRDRERALR